MLNMDSAGRKLEHMVDIIVVKQDTEVDNIVNKDNDSNDIKEHTEDNFETDFKIKCKNFYCDEEGSFENQSFATENAIVENYEVEVSNEVTNTDLSGPTNFDKMINMAFSNFDIKHGSVRPKSESLDIEIDDSEAYIEDDVDVGIHVPGHEEVFDKGISNVTRSETVHEKSIAQTGIGDFEGDRSVHEDQDLIEDQDNEVGVFFTIDEDDDSKEEDEEVEEIMKSSDMLDRIQEQIKRNVRDKMYEEAKMYRQRSKSVDNGRRKTSVVDFSKYGISVGVNSANDLLPGIEEFLCSVLARETLSPYAEEQRQYFLERLDIIKMPPSIPPRPQSLGVNLFPVDSSSSLPSRSSIPSAELEDFAAYQRELSRALVEPDVSPEPAEVKVYDDIDIPVGELSVSDAAKSTQEGEESMYEIPQLKRSLSESGYEKAIDLSLVSKAASTENLLSREEPPPLPPRSKDDNTFRSSIGSMLDERTQGLVHKDTPTHREPIDNKSEKSSDDLLEYNTDEPMGMSCDSIDGVGLVDAETEMLRKLGVQLPQPKLKKRKSTRRKLGHSLSALKESNTSFRALEEVVLSGELHYRSKLSWTKKLVALTNGRLVCYKADKPDCRPSQIVVLTGYQALYHKRDSKRGFEINLHHDNFESHTFLSDFKEWAEIWCQHINAAAEGKKGPGPVLHLVRGSTLAGSEGECTLGRTNLDSSSSNLSLASSDGFDCDPGTVKVKKRDVSGTRTARMGSFAYKATQFFESLGKRSLRKSTSTEVYRQHTLSASQTSLSESQSPVTPESGIAEETPAVLAKHIKHQGYLDIYSSFNKRKWGKRWCMVHDNSFECYRTQTSDVCELEFLLQNCILRRAIEETKSELGLVLIENQREKITIEPLNWTELGSWLRVLMQETSTPTVPDGLQGYMDETNPYHEAIEITRLSDPFPASPPIISPGVNERTLVNNNSDDEDHRHSTPSRNRDSGNCSAESMFGSLERKSNETRTHPSYSDSSLPRVSIGGSGDIYTQVRKPNLTLENRARSKYGTEMTEKDTGSTKFDFDFSTTVPAIKPGESLMDEIMSQFKTQIGEPFESEHKENDFTNENDNFNTSVNRKPRKLSDPKEILCEIETVVSPIKDNTADTAVASTTKNVLCSSFLDDSTNTDTADEQNKDKLDHKYELNEVEANEDNANCDSQSLGPNGANTHETEVSLRPHTRDNSERVLRKNSSVVHDAETVQRNLDELRTTLVQLKKDRISIRDRKQKTTSEIDREYLDAEFNRLNRECNKVQEEINYFGKLQETQTAVSNITDIGTEEQQTENDKEKTANTNVGKIQETINYFGKLQETQTAVSETTDIGTEEQQTGNDKEKTATTSEGTDQEIRDNDGASVVKESASVKPDSKGDKYDANKNDSNQNVNCATEIHNEIVSKLKRDDMHRTEEMLETHECTGAEKNFPDNVNNEKNPEHESDDEYVEIKDVIREELKHESDNPISKSLLKAVAMDENKCNDSKVSDVEKDSKLNGTLSDNDGINELLCAFETKLTIHSSESE